MSIAKLSEQLNQLVEQMNARFDGIDKRLDTELAGINSKLTLINRKLDVMSYATETTAGTNIGMSRALQEMQDRMVKRDPTFNPTHPADLYNQGDGKPLKKYKEEYRRRIVEELGLDEYPFQYPTS